MTQALILIDIQNDYFKGGNMECVGMERAAENAATLLDAFRREGKPRFHIQHIATREGATFFLPGTTGAETHESVAPVAGEPVLTKHVPNSFRDTSLGDDLEKAGVLDLVICGAMTHMCVDATTRAAFDLGFRCTVAADACATRDLEYNGEVIPAQQVQGAFMAALAVPYARVVSTGEILGAGGEGS